MSDQTEGTITVGEDGDKPITPPSQPQSVSEISGGQSISDLVGLIVANDDFIKSVQNLQQSGLQSVKDKRFAKIENKLENANENLARLAKYLNVEPDKLAEAQQRVRYDENMEYIEQLRQGRATSLGTQGSDPNLSEARSTLLVSSGLTQAPDGFDDFLAKLNWANPFAATLQAQEWLSKAKENIKQPQPSDTAPPTGGGGDPLNPYPGLSDDELGALLETLMIHPNKGDNSERIDKIAAELERRDNLKK